MQNKLSKFCIPVLLISSILYNCDSENTRIIYDPPGSLELLRITNLKVEDNNNQANASDINIAFNKVVNETKLLEYRVFVLKDSSATNFNLDLALTTDRSNYTVIDKIGSDISTSLPAEALNTDGDIIVEDTLYTVFVVAVADSSSTNAVSGLSNGVEITLN